ncbi:MAG TPA: hypothetical protein VGB36_09615 [Gammaproteobacteria bacterium]
MTRINRLVGDFANNDNEPSLREMDRGAVPDSRREAPMDEET